DRRTLVARNVPPSATGTPVDLEFWLDAQKMLNAACHLGGSVEPYPLVGSSFGPEELLTRLDNAMFDAEAKLEANAKGKTDGLLKTLDDKLKLAAQVRNQAAMNRDGAEAAFEGLRDAIDLVEERASGSELASASADVQARDIVRGWLPFFEVE